MMNGAMAGMPYQNLSGTEETRKTRKQNDEVCNKVEAVMEGDFIEHAHQCQAATGAFPT
jgi:hypothetical protein